MSKKDKKFDTSINEKEFKIIVHHDDRYVMAVPLPSNYSPSGLHLFKDGLYHHYDVYNENGEKDRIYLNGFDNMQNLYVTSGNNHYKIETETNIKLLPVDKIPKLDYSISGNTLAVGSNAKGWVFAISNKPFPAD